MKGPRTLISAEGSSWIPKWKELLKYKDLFVSLVLRDFKIRYAQTFIGVIWAIIQPLFTIGILYLVFTRFLEVPTPVPPLLYITAAMTLWGYFSFVLTQSGASLIQQQDLIRKVYFPRLILPLSKAALGLIDYLVYLILLTILLFYYGTPLSAKLLFIPLVIFYGALSALAIGIWVSALSIKYRDIQQVVPFVVQLGLYATPIAYSSSLVLEHLPTWGVYLYYLNPVAGGIQCMRWILFNEPMPVGPLVFSMIWTTVLFVSGLIYFTKSEKHMSDVL